MISINNSSETLDFMSLLQVDMLQLLKMWHSVLPCVLITFYQSNFVNHLFKLSDLYTDISMSNI